MTDAIDARDELASPRSAPKVSILDRRRFLAVSSMAAAAFAVSCTTGSPAATTAATQSGTWAKGIRVRFFTGGDAGDAFASIVYKGAQQAQADLGVTVDYVFSGWDVNKMTSQLRDAIAAKPDGIAMMGHPGDDAIRPLAQQAHDAGILMEYQNVDVPTVRQSLGGGYVGAVLTPQGAALGQSAIQSFNLKSGDRAIVFGAWDEPGRFLREEGTAKAFETAGLVVDRIITPTAAGSDPNVLTPIVSAAYLKHPTTKVICYSGGQTLSAVPSYMKAISKGPGDVINIGFDLSPAVIDAFKQGYVQLTSDQQPFLQGYLPVLSLCLSKKWNFSALSYDSGAGLVTKSNYQSVAALATAGIR
jgi:simple sugar transport system substrate-binding protein